MAARGWNLDRGARQPPVATGVLSALLTVGTLFAATLHLAPPVAAAPPAGSTPGEPALDNDDRLDLPLNPGGQYRPGVPSPEDFLGWPLGQRFTPHARIIDYVTKLVETGADRCRWAKDE